MQTKLAKNPPTQTRIIICPPFTSLTAIRDALQDRNIELGAQNIAWEEEGAYTGEISAKMVKSAGAR
ncbi:triose-phosphate isomerase, partial [Candidatus Saccharibacteria bacterium]|nr:triose-phosphate isomerase [Candidatus Saccharibacteria bacterium]NIV03560.1 triose-phosphate isomerase [Calditrichia bacterium]NIV71826.1 triose-phosphate isomerase [Calditrichia bacterium]NIV98538.1 triose-phosphate isomerase [Candidatus Saccharibacteria bacterium]NIW78795.1 triose-phosphate isomerase [Calditrichia bacterium]